MNVYLSAAAEKVYNKINEPDKSRLYDALYNLSQEPPQGDITKLKGQESYRARVGGWRIVFGINPDHVDPETNEKGAIVVSKIGARGDVYKGV